MDLLTYRFKFSAVSFLLAILALSGPELGAQEATNLIGLETGFSLSVKYLRVAQFPKPSNQLGLEDAFWVRYKHGSGLLLGAEWLGFPHQGPVLLVGYVPIRTSDWEVAAYLRPGFLYFAQEKTAPWDSLFKAWLWSAGGSATWYFFPQWGWVNEVILEYHDWALPDRAYLGAGVRTGISFRF